MVFTSSRINIGRNTSFKSKNRRRITVNPNFNSCETSNSKKSNSDDVIRNSNLPHINVHTENTQSSIITNDEMTDENNIIEEISCQHDNVMYEKKQRHSIEFEISFLILSQDTTYDYNVKFWD